MKKRILLIIVMLILTVILLIKIKPEKEYHLKEKDAIAIMVYDETNEEYVPSNTFPTGDYDIDFENSYCKNGSTIKSYNRRTRTVTITMSTADECYVYFVPGEEEILTAADEIADLVGTTGTDGSGNAWGVVEDHGIRYVGQNPDNWIWFNCSDLSNQNATNCERWRIIGVFNEKYDTNNDGIPDTEGELIKIIRNDSLGDNAWDYKQNGVGSSTNDSGSNDWSDSQAMMMLNPPRFINSGYVSENAANPVHNWAINGEYVMDTSQTIYRNMGSYFDSAKTAYKPASTTTSGFTSTTQASASTFKRMSSASQSMIATTKWYVAGHNTNALTASEFYNYERNGNVTANRPKIWYGKIGLMYPSDYGYATNGTLNTSANGIVLSRNECLTHEISMWRSTDASTSYYNCAISDWLLYEGATGNTSATKGSAKAQWTITPTSSSVNNLIYFGSTGRAIASAASGERVIRPVLYIVPDTKITSGSGTYSQPFALSPTVQVVDNIIASNTIIELVGTTGTDGNGNTWGVVNDHGIRYVGQNPNNYVLFNNELWRIIGVFNEKYDTNNDGIPDTEGNLVKIIRNDSLGNYSWDDKQSSVGSSTINIGSNDWSDSQLMMMLNPTTFLNSGYVNEEDTNPVHSNTINGEYIQSGSINIFKNMGSYFDSTKTAYKPYDTYSYGYGYNSSGTALTESTSNVLADTSTFKRMNPASQSMIATVKWYLTGTANYKSNTTGLASHFYNYERNIDNAGAVYNTSRPKIWYGKIGLMYPSDYGYATNGTLSTSENGVVLTRNECLTHELYNWRINNTSSSNYNCGATDWLLYPESTSSSIGNPTGQWTITPYSSNVYHVFFVYRTSRVDYGSPSTEFAIRPVLYLGASTKIVSGNGTSGSPFVLSQ